MRLGLGAVFGKVIQHGLPIDAWTDVNVGQTSRGERGIVTVEKRIIPRRSKRLPLRIGHSIHIGLASFRSRVNELRNDVFRPFALSQTAGVPAFGMSSTAIDDLCQLPTLVLTFQGTTAWMYRYWGQPTIRAHGRHQLAQYERLFSR